MYRAVLLFALGLAAGWLWFGESPAPERSGGRRATPRESPEGETEGASTPAKPATRKELSSEHPAGLSIYHVDGKPRYQMGTLAITPRPLALIDGAMRKARSEKNWPEFLAGILELIVHDSVEADRRLVAILADPTLALPHRIGNHFYEGLVDSGVEGIAAAARTRAEMEIAVDPGYRWAGEGYLALVARFGSDADLEWIESLATSRTRAIDVNHQLAKGAANPAAAERLRDRILESKNRRLFPFMFPQEFARTNPAIAFETAVAVSNTASDSDKPRAFRLMGMSVDKGTLPRARDLILSLKDDAARLCAIEGVEQIRRRDLPVTAFADVLETPRRILEHGLDGEGGSRNVERAIAVVRSCRVAQTEPNLAALRAVAERGAGDLARKAQDALREIEAARNRSRERWEPERPR